MKIGNQVKVWLTCPESHADEVRIAIGDAGIGVIGNYTHCCFVSKGKGYFKPNSLATPFVGKTGDIEIVDEVVIEFVCHVDQIELLKEVIKKYHPYEEVAMDIFPLLED